MNDQRNLLVVSGPSGIGKDTVVKCLLESHEGIELSVSATTRAPRSYEQDGVDYHFLKEAEFLRRVDAGDFVEYARYAGNYYGTLKSEVDRRIQNGIVCVLVIEVNGAANVKRLYPGCTTVFLVPPSFEELERRLRGRGSEDGDALGERLRIAKDEMAAAPGYDFTLVNDTVQHCADELYRIVTQRQRQ